MVAAVIAVTYMYTTDYRGEQLYAKTFDSEVWSVRVTSNSWQVPGLHWFGWPREPRARDLLIDAEGVTRRITGVRWLEDVGVLTCEL